MKEVTVHEERVHGVTLHAGTVTYFHDRLRFYVRCPDHQDGPYEASMLIEEETPERLGCARAQLRQAYLDHRGQMH